MPKARQMTFIDTSNMHQGGSRYRDRLDKRLAENSFLPQERLTTQPEWSLWGVVCVRPDDALPSSRTGIGRSLLENDFGRAGWAFVETDGEYADLGATIVGFLEGQFSTPIRVIAFNTAERWSEDVSEDIAHELRRRTTNFSDQ